MVNVYTCTENKILNNYALVLWLKTKPKYTKIAKNSDIIFITWYFDTSTVLHKSPTTEAFVLVVKRPPQPPSIDRTCPARTKWDDIDQCSRIIKVNMDELLFETKPCESEHFLLQGIQKNSTNSNFNILFVRNYLIP